MKPQQLQDIKPVLKEGVIYEADNGQLICLKCAGSSAKFTGHDRSGKRVRALNKGADNASWFTMFGKPLACEAGCTVYPKPTN